MTKIDYKCKFCHRPGSTSYDGTMIQPANLPAWAEMLACNQCSDYRAARRAIVDNIGEVCMALSVSARDADRKTKLSASLEKLTKRLCAVVCDHYKLANIWDKDFADMLAEKPLNYKILVNQYVRGVSTIARQQKTC